MNPETKLATLHVYINPLTSWIWLGALILILGAAVSTWPDATLAEVGVGAYLRSAGATAASLVLGLLLALTPARVNAQTSSSMAGEVHMNSPEEKELFSNLLCECGSCDRLPLSNCTCDWADGMRKKLSSRLAMGESRASIIEWYGREHGQAALNVPKSKSVWMIPLIMMTLGGIGAVFLVRGWTRKPPAPPKPVADEKKQDQPTDEYDKKLDDELDDDDSRR